MTAHIMLDIETLGLKPGKNPILSIGMVKFYDNGWVDLTDPGANEAFYTEINVETQEQYGLIKDPDTVRWWSRPEHPRTSFDAALRSMRNETNVEIWTALGMMDDFLRKYDEPPFIWGNSIDFDNAFIRETHKLVFDGLDPWTHQQGMCYRTLKRLRADIPLVETPDRKHHAFYDALDQARHAQQILYAMGVF